MSSASSSSSPPSSSSYSAPFPHFFGSEDLEIAYKTFTQSVPLQKVLLNPSIFFMSFLVHLINFPYHLQITVTDVQKTTWNYYECGPKNMEPLICISPLQMGASCFFYQFLSLCPKGYRVISV